MILIVGQVSSCPKRRWRPGHSKYGGRSLSSATGGAGQHRIRQRTILLASVDPFWVYRASLNWRVGALIAWFTQSDHLFSYEIPQASCPIAIWRLDQLAL